ARAEATPTLGARVQRQFIGAVALAREARQRVAGLRQPVEHELPAFDEGLAVLELDGVHAEGEERVAERRQEQPARPAVGIADLGGAKEAAAARRFLACRGGRAS